MKKKVEAVKMQLGDDKQRYQVRQERINQVG